MGDSDKLTTMVLTMYKHLTREQRYGISALLAKGFALTDSADETQVAVAISTASREIKRKRSKRKYRAAVAQEWADVRKERLVHNNHTIKLPLKERVLKLIKEEQWSPKQISGYRKRDGEKVAYETIYKWIREDKKDGGNRYKNCRHQLNLSL